MANLKAQVEALSQFTTRWNGYFPYDLPNEVFVKLSDVLALLAAQPEPPAMTGDAMPYLRELQYSLPKLIAGTTPRMFNDWADVVRYVDEAIKLAEQLAVLASEKASAPTPSAQPDPTQQPEDKTGQGRFMLNSYGMACYDLGYEAAKAKASPSTPSAWQPAETAPKEGAFLVHHHGAAGRRTMVADGRMFWLSRATSTPDHLSGHHWTHWMLLPSPPVEPEP